MIGRKGWQWLSMGAFSVGMGLAVPALATEAPGATSGEILRTLGIIAGILAFVGLVLVEFVYRSRLSRGFYHWLLLVGLLVLPIIAILGTSATVFEETKKVSACGSCHVMDAFVSDMRNPESPTLAARHYKNKWIADKQCYSCHTTYGAHGTIEAKRDGFRHWLLYVTDTYKEPIQYSGSYPNINCLTCHANTTAFESVTSHQALRADLLEDKVGCYTCHGPPHPSPLKRPLTKGGAPNAK